MAAEIVEKGIENKLARVIIDADSAARMRAELVGLKRASENDTRACEEEVKRILSRKRQQERNIATYDRLLALLDLLPTETEQPLR